MFLPKYIYNKYFLLLYHNIKAMFTGNININIGISRGGNKDFIVT